MLSVVQFGKILSRIFYFFKYFERHFVGKFVKYVLGDLQNILSAIY